jgi:hypothetical protein
MKSGFQRDKLAQTENSSSQMKAFCDTAKIEFKPQTTGNARTKSKNFFACLAYFAVEIFLANQTCPTQSRILKTEIWRG